MLDKLKVIVLIMVLILRIKKFITKTFQRHVFDYANEIGADLISIMSERESPTGFFMGHYAQQLVNKSNISVLTMHVKNTRIAGGGGY